MNNDFSAKKFYSFIAPYKKGIPMLKIGIVDVTTVGSTICQRRLSELGGDHGDHPEFAVHSIPFSLYRTAVITKNWKMMSELIGESLKQLNLLRPDFVIIPSNTPHYAYKQFIDYSFAPVLNLISVTAEACKKAGLKKVAILGTDATMTGGLYKEALESEGIELVTPNKEIRKVVHEFIMNEIVPGKVKLTTRKRALDLIKTISCDGFILGCTELPEVFTKNDLGKTTIDTTRLLAEVAFDIAKAGDLKAIKKFSSVKSALKRE
jgi:aspartate racemase